MTRTEAKDILIERLDFRVDSPTNESGRFFEGEHPVVTLENIKACQPEVGISDNDFSNYLTTLKTDVVYQVLADVSDKDDFYDDLLTFYPALFDTAISIQMAIKVIDLILIATRSNRIQSITEDAAKLLFYDSNGQDGLKERYQREIRRIQGKTSDELKFKSITNG